MNSPICRTVLMANKNKSSGIIVLRYLECHKPNCDWCQTQKAKKYHALIAEPAPMIMSYKVVDDDTAQKVSIMARQSGGFYLRVPLGGYSAVVSTMNVSPLWIPYPTDVKDDSILILKNWIANKRGRISSTRKAQSKSIDVDKPSWDTCFISKAGYDKVSDFLHAGNWINKKHDIFVPTLNSVDWETVVRFMEAADIPVKERIVKKITEKLQYPEKDPDCQFSQKVLTIGDDA